MEIYYNLVAGIRARMLKGNLHRLLRVIFRAGQAKGIISDVPDIRIRFSPLWSLSALELADSELSHARAELAKAKAAAAYVHMGAITGEEIRRGLKAETALCAETLLDE